MNSRRKVISLIVISSLVLNSFIFPQEAYARNIFKDLFRGIKRTTRFIVKLPDKATRWMGPVLGPIASAVLTKNLIKNPRLGKIFRRARKVHGTIQKVEDLQKHLKDVKTVYNDQAKELRQKADELEQTRKDLAKDLLKHGDLDEYKDQVAAIQGLIELHRKAADKFENAANNMTTKHVSKMLGNEVLNSALGHIKDAVILETMKELDKVIDPEIISKFLSSGGGLDAVLDFFVDSELQKAYGDTKDKGDIDLDALKDRIRNSIKQQLRKDRDYLKSNWREKIDELIDKEIKEMQEVANDAESQTQKVTEEIAQQKLSKEQQEIIDKFEKNVKEAENAIKDPNDKCGPGYIFKPRSGVGCVQINCDKAADGAHLSYVGYCICNSAGSINENPEDANVACKFPPSYESCPRCTYACVHAGEKCPLDGVTFD